MYIWTWSADKAVDGCYRRTETNNPNDRCCATSDGLFNNFWKVDLLGQYVVDQIIVYSRGDGKRDLLSRTRRNIVCILYYVLSLSMAYTCTINDNYYMWCQHNVYRGMTLNVNPFESKNDYITFTIIFVLCV